MAKELPYFRFYPSEWLEGDITLENEKTQGFFIQLCAWYWKKDCEVDLKFINKRLINGKAMLKQCLNDLIDNNIIKIDEYQNVTIHFLDKQLDVLGKKRNKLVESGRKGGQASVKHRSSYKEKDKDNNKDNNKDKDVKIDSFQLKFDNFISGFNLLTNRNFKGDIKTKRQLKDRLKEGYTGQDFSQAIKALYNDEFHKENGFKFATPEFITRADKLEMYVNKEEIKKEDNTVDYDWNKKRNYKEPDLLKTILDKK